MNSTGITLFFAAADRIYFDKHLDAVRESGRYPGLLEGEASDCHPSDATEMAGRPFVGFHGSCSGDYPAALMVSSGDGKVFDHPCDEDGNISLPGTGVGGQPQVGGIAISNKTMGFVMMFNRRLADMLDAAAKSAEARIGALEKEGDKRGGILAGQG